jgi:hypothetical protein
VAGGHQTIIKQEIDKHDHPKVEDNRFEEK